MKFHNSFKLPAAAPEAKPDIGADLSQGAVRWPFPIDGKSVDPYAAVAQQTKTAADKFIEDGTPAAQPRKAAKSKAMTAEYGDAMPAMSPESIQPTALKVIDAKKREAAPVEIEAKNCAVILHNNSRTPYENVVETLEATFKLNRKEAERIMYEAHNAGERGRAVVVKDMTLLAAEDAAKNAMQFASKLDNKRGSTLRFSVLKNVL